MIAQAQITIADLNDPIQQGEAPASPVPGMLWLDTSSIRKRAMLGKNGSESGEAHE